MEVDLSELRDALQELPCPARPPGNQPGIQRRANAPIDIPNRRLPLRITPRKLRYIRARSLDRLPQFEALSREERFALRVVSEVFPFRTNNYVVEELIDWSRGFDDPLLRLHFPHREMLGDDDFRRMAADATLSNLQVRNFIESTCAKVSPVLYPYAITPGRPNGTWHQEMGYGRINAQAALAAAAPITPITPITTITETPNSNRNGRMIQRRTGLISL